MDSTDDDPPCIVRVDDEEELEEYMFESEQEVACEVVAVDTGAQCLQVLGERAVDCVVSEYDLPDMCGLDLLKQVREIVSDVPFVLLTSNGSEAVASRAVGAGVSDYISKRASLEAVSERLRGCLAGQGSTARLSEVAERYRTLVETSPTPVLIFDSDGDLVFGNDAFLDLLGAPTFAEVRGRHISEFVHPDDHDAIKKRMERVLEEGEPAPRTELTVTRPDGERRRVQLATAPGTRHGERIGQAIITDVTALYRTERELQAERQSIESALDTLDDLFYVVSPEGGLLHWNERAVEVTGYTEAELAGMDLDDLFIGDDASRVFDSLKTVLSEGSDVVEATLVTKQGRTVPFELRGRRLTDEEGDVVGVAGNRARHLRPPRAGTGAVPPAGATGTAQSH